MSNPSNQLYPMVPETSINDLKSERNTMCSTKKEIISLRLDVKVTFSLQERKMCIA
jgi:hypothetical protein